MSNFHKQKTQAVFALGRKGGPWSPCVALTQRAPPHYPDYLQDPEPPPGLVQCKQHYSVYLAVADRPSNITHVTSPAYSVLSPWFFHPFGIGVVVFCYFRCRCGCLVSEMWTVSSRRGTQLFNYNCHPLMHRESDREGYSQPPRSKAIKSQNFLKQRRGNLRVLRTPSCRLSQLPLQPQKLKL